MSLTKIKAPSGIYHRRLVGRGLSLRHLEKAKYAMTFTLSPNEEDLTDALYELPTPLMVKRLIELMPPKELREFTEGMVNDTTEAVKTLRPIEVANTINDWVATAEEMVTNRRSHRHIRAARERADAVVGVTE